MAPGGHAETSNVQSRGSDIGSRISKSESRSGSAESRSRIGDFISKRTPTVSPESRQNATTERSLRERTDNSGVTQPRGSRTDNSANERRPSDDRRGEIERRRDATVAEPDKRIDGIREHRGPESNIADRTRDRGGPDRSRLDRAPETRTDIGGDRSTLDRTARIDGTRVHRYTTVSPSYVTYYDRPDLVTHSYRYDYAYRDYNGLWCSRLVWPSYRILIGYNCGPYFGFHYFYPYYHRKYIFVSLGGYWPYDYCYTRYYWYGWHPYYWYGYYPVAHEVQDATYNYYTYNYYTDGEQTATYRSQTPDPRFENLAQQPAEPPEATLADTYFEEGVKAFETADYNTAVLKFTKAMELAPDDMILPFALSQALMASGQYSNAAAILRDALAKVKPDKEGVFYPRGLYPDEQRLLGQIDLLAGQAEKYSFDADLQLLLGYQLLGIGQTDRAVEPLMNAQKDMVNANAATVLFGLLQKVKTPSAPAPEQKPAIEQKPADHNHSPAPASSSAGPFEGRPITDEIRLVGEGHLTGEESAIVRRPAPIVAKAKALGLKENMMLAGMCALVATAGVRHFVHS